MNGAAGTGDDVRARTRRKRQERSFLEFIQALPALEFLGFEGEDLPKVPAVWDSFARTDVEPFSTLEESASVAAADEWVGKLVRDMHTGNECYLSTIRDLPWARIRFSDGCWGQLWEALGVHDFLLLSVDGETALGISEEESAFWAVRPPLPRE